MAIQNLDKIFKPKRVAVIGASATTTSVGHTVLRNLISAEFPGTVYPVNPRCESVHGIQAYGHVAELPNQADLAVICTPPATVPDVVRECGEAGVLGLIIISAGFREAGKEGEALSDRVRQTAARFDGMRIVGPNCLGVIAPPSHLNASFAARMPGHGRVAFISQSGALCSSVLDWAISEQIGFSYFVSVGNMLDVGVGDLIDYFSLDQWTESIILYVESINEAREFMSAARAFTRIKPIVAYKAGRFVESAQATASHTGAMAGVDAVYEAAFNRAGIVRVFEMDDMFDCAELLARQAHPRGSRLAIITNAGGPGVMATDALIERNGVLASLGEKSIRELDAILPSSWSRRNPVDVLGDATPERFAEAVRLVLADSQVDAALVILTPQAMTDPTATANAIAEVSQSSGKPLLASWMGGASVQQGVQALNNAGIPTYTAPEPAVRAFMYLVSYARNRQILYETPRDIPVDFSLDRSKLDDVFQAILGEEQEVLTESASKALLKAYDIPVTEPLEAQSPKEAVASARRIGYPVVMKILSPQITHKTDVGGVELNISSDAAVERAYARIISAARDHRPDADVSGVTIQRMITSPVGYELIVGAKRDAVFGPVLLVGAGGITAELYQDRALELPPLSERLARRMLESLRSWPLLRGYRGRQGINIDRLIELLMRVSYLVADYPEVMELDINPLLTTPKEVIALDARIVLDREWIGHKHRPFSHLAIGPIPEEFVRQIELKDGSPILLRPIRPEDEPMWHELLANCSRESLWSRFRYVFKSTTHEMATRFCFIDYDREIAIVAEVEENSHRRLVGVGRLVAGADHRDAEYAVLIADAWQNRGLGALLTDYCLEICHTWGIPRVVAETTPANGRMLDLFQQRGFQIDNTTYSDTVVVHKEL